MREEPIPSAPPTLDYTNRRLGRRIVPPDPLPPQVPTIPVAYPPAEPSQPFTPQLIAFVIVPIVLVLGILIFWFYESTTLQ